MEAEVFNIATSSIYQVHWDESKLIQHGIAVVV